jgi:hypothetical protein
MELECQKPSHPLILKGEKFKCKEKPGPFGLDKDLENKVHAE